MKSKKAMRIAIAKDVLARLKAKKLHVHTGVYCDTLRSSHWFAPCAEDAQQHIDKIEANCGAIDQLKDFFNKDQLAAIEAAFEINRPLAHYSKIGYEALAFGIRYPDDDKRLAAIFRNIVRNDGTFKPLALKKRETVRDDANQVAR